MPKLKTTRKKMSKQETTGNSPSVYDLNKWIEKLKRCEAIQEADVKACATEPEKFCKRRVTCSMCRVPSR